MLAFAWRWAIHGDESHEVDPARLAASLCAGIGGNAVSAGLEGLAFAWRPLRGRAATRGWRPARLHDGRHVAFHGYLDNAAAIAEKLGTAVGEPAALYARALEVWGGEADHRIVGEYCVIVADVERRKVRLSRSPLRAPPLLYHHGDGLVAAASVPRAIFAAGVAMRFDERRAADSAMRNFTDLEASWYEGLARVPLGTVIELEPGAPRRLRTFYDLAAAPRQTLPSTEAYATRMSELLDEAVRVTTAPFRHLGATLSSGLDSAQVAVRAAALLPPGQRLPTFTFHPEPDWDGVTDRGTSGDERPMVEAFAALHPELDPQFTTNAGYGHDHRWDDLFMAMGGAPSGLCNMYVFHGLFGLAAKARCDVLLIAEWGNLTFSDKGDWAFVEYLFTGRWRQLWLALKHHPHDDRSLLRRFVAKCLVPLLPDRWWRLLMRWWHPGEKSRHEMIIPLRAEYRKASGANRRQRAEGFEFGRYQPRSRDHARRLEFAILENESAEIYQGFEQLYGVACRDPLAYRPLVEFCFGLPTDLFVRDGEQRWLAKELGRGIMPEEQRRNRLNGRWDADWHVRIARRRDEYRGELDRIEADPQLGAMIDVPRLRAALEGLTEGTSTDRQEYYPIEFALMRGLLTARFIRFVAGRNTA